MGQRVKEFEASGVAPNGRLYAGDLLAIQDQYADLENLLQNFSTGAIAVGESGLQILRYGAGDLRITGSARTDSILRALGGLLGGTFTTAERNALGVGLAPATLIIFNSTTDRYEYNSGTDGARDWQPLGDIFTGAAAGGDLTGTYPNPDIGAGKVGTAEIADGAVTAIKLGVTIPVPAIATTVAGLGTGTDGKIGLIVAGASPYEFATMVYSATYGKWVTAPLPDPTWVTAGGFNGTNTAYALGNVAAVAGPRYPWAPFNTAGLTPQLRVGGSTAVDLAATQSIRPVYGRQNDGGAITLVPVTGAGGEASTSVASSFARGGWVVIDSGFTVTDYIAPGIQAKTSNGANEWNLGPGWQTEIRWVG